MGLGLGRAVTVGVVCAVLVAGCTGPREGPSPSPSDSTAAVGQSQSEPGSAQDLAESIARGFNAGDWGSVPWTSADAGQVPADAGQVPADAGQVPADAGQVPADAGQVPADAGQVPADAGQVPADADDLPADASGSSVPGTSADAGDLPADADDLPATPGADASPRSSPAGASAARWLAMVHDLRYFASEMTLREVVDPPSEAPEGGTNAVTARYRVTWQCFPRGIDSDDAAATFAMDTWARLVHQGASANRGQGEWQAVWTTALIVGEAMDDDAELVERRDAAQRGEILGADGAVLVTDRNVDHVGVNKPMVPEGEDAAEIARRLAEVLEVDPDEYARRVEAAGPQGFVPALTLRAGQVDAYDLSEFGEAVLVQAAMLPLAPTREFARALLGTAGEATAEIVEDSSGAIEAGDVVGLSGLQRVFDELLRGRPGVVLRVEPPTEPPGEVTGDQPSIELGGVESDPGQSVTLTLDEGIQQAADNAVATAAGERAALVAIRPSSGALVAIANSPATEGVNIAMEGRYPPGSVFKVATTLAMIREGMRADTTVTCPSTLTVDGRQFGNYDGYPASRLGSITLEQAFASSCNTAFLGAADVISQEALATAAADLGVGVTMHLGIDAFAGEVPGEAQGTEHAAELIGQGQVVVTPLTMAVVAASAMAGTRVAPQLVTVPRDSGSDYASGPSGLTEDEAATLRSMMRATVTSGTAGIFADLGKGIGAKTGTAEFGDELPPRTHAWMLVTDSEADLAVAVLVEGGGSGSETAGPIAAAFLAQAREAREASEARETSAEPASPA
ncbi:MAG: hypothetical protein LBK72_11225 [Bifidobacteriaceae bacterium]|jgi:cell division protein FtsI/penicillin-binding protein 2|nr:hypothetical protein [Bifidobacteriaceae bacterium]